jgi:WD40 repeat protein
MDYTFSLFSVNEIGVWGMTTGKEIAQLKHENFVCSVSFSPDGKYLATASKDMTAQVSDI